MMQTEQAVTMPRALPGGACLDASESFPANLHIPRRTDCQSVPPPEAACQSVLHRTEAAALLERVVRAVEEAVGPRSFAHWFRDQVAFALDEEGFVVRVASPFLANWIQKHFRGVMQAAAGQVLGPSACTRFEVDARLSPVLDEPERKSGPAAAAGPSQAPRAAGSSQSPRPGGPGRPEPAGHRRESELGDFVVGDCNRLAWTAAQQVAESPGARLNPLYLHGGVGLGKTHLLEGIHRRLRRRFPALRVLLLTSEMFANHFTEALRARTLPAFRQKFRSLDVLLVDDVDFLDGKRVIQEEFLHTFKQLESQHKQLVLTADRHPRLLLKSSDELMTRFLAGMVCRIEAPDADTRRNIVVARARRLGAPFGDEALEYVAGRFRNNVRELEGALNCLATWHAMTGRPVSLSAARRVLADLERDCIRIIQPADVAHTVCEFFGVCADDLRSPRRHQAIVRPRMLAMYLMRKHTQAAYSEIGRFFGGRNHATVMSAERKVRGWLESRTLIPSLAGAWPADELVANLEQQLLAS